MLKKFILRALARMDGLPMSEPTLHGACAVLTPAPLLSELAQTMGALQVDGYVVATRDALDNTIYYRLTTKGDLAAKSLE